MTVEVAYHEICEKLKNAEIPDYSFEAKWIIKHFSGENFLSKRLLTEVEEILINGAKNRRIQGEPLQYIIGEWEFYSLPFYTSSGVLIPRTDTETLVDAALYGLQDITMPKILDLCTGSGCVAVTLAKHMPNAKVIAADLYDKPLLLCQKNIERNSLKNCEILKLDVLKQPEIPLDFDLITCNPPYIKSSDMNDLQREVLFEPKTALDGGEDGLLFYKSLCENFAPKMKEGAMLAVEIGYDISEEVSTLFEKEFKKIKKYKDINKQIRVITGIK